MKKIFLLMVLTGAVILNASLVLEGCNGKLPVSANFIPTALPTQAPNVVDNFEDGDIYLNRNLFNTNPTNPGVWSALPAVNFVVPGGANGTAMSSHMSGGPTVVGGYGPYYLTAVPNPNGPYDLSAAAGATFTGIQFYWKTGPSDNMAGRWFICPVAKQLPPPLGDCPGTGGGCYDTYKVSLNSYSSPVTSNWVLVTIPWSSLNQAGWGTPQVGPLSGSYNGVPNLSKIEYFQWEEDPNNVTNTYTIDFWLDEIQLY